MQCSLMQTAEPRTRHNPLRVVALLGLALAVLTAAWAPPVRAADEASTGIGDAELARLVAGYTAERASKDVPHAGPTSSSLRCSTREIIR